MKKVYNTIYTHQSYINQLPKDIKKMVYKAKRKAKIKSTHLYNIVKVNTDEMKISFLLYQNFNEIAHPELYNSIFVNLETNKVTTRDFTTHQDRPILHRKDLIVSPSYPYYNQFLYISKQEIDAHLIPRCDIGYKKQWERLLTLKGYEINNHILTKKEIL